MLRFALLNGKTAGDQVAAYLPEAYEVVGYIANGDMLIQGEDVAGWTLDGYVLPRLASGLIFGKEIDREVAWDLNIVADAQGISCEPRGRVQ